MEIIIHQAILHVLDTTMDNDWHYLASGYGAWFAVEMVGFVLLPAFLYALGVREKSIIFHHIIPNVMSLILVNATLSFATCMLTESSLSYMGFGIAPPTPTWGNMLTGANNSIVIQQYWWRWVFPAAIFGICTICINLVGDALRDAVDPKSAER